MSMASAEKMFKVLETLCHQGPAKAAALGRELDFNKSSVHRFLNCLMAMGYVSQCPETGYYSAGLKIYEMGAQVKNRWGIARIAAPILHRLQVEVNEAVNLGVLHNNEMLTLERFTPDDESIKIVVKAKLPAYCTALGKILLAYLDLDCLEKYLVETDFKAYTDRTVVVPECLRVMIAEIRQTGIAVDDRELDDNIRSIATPIYDDNGIVVAGMSISASAMRLSGEYLDEAKNKLLVATGEVCRALGHVTAC